MGLVLKVAVVAWQGVICFCAAVTKHIAALHLLIFLQLGGGTLFGGLLIALDDIPWPFRYVRPSALFPVLVLVLVLV